MKLLTASLEGKALDWALNHALMLEHGFVPEIAGALGKPSEMYNHADPAVCMLLTHKMNIMQQANDGSWRVASSCVKGKKHKAHGKTLEQAVARCVVAMRLGEEVDELCGEQKPHKPTEPQCLYDQHGGDLEDELAIS
jgi:hypothetical protein